MDTDSDSHDEQLPGRQMATYVYSPKGIRVAIIWPDGTRVDVHPEQDQEDGEGRADSN